MLHRLAAASLVAGLLAWSGCTPQPPAALGRSSGPIDLQPLPEPPPLQIAPDVLPGADGALAVVVARPQGPTSGIVRPTITFSRPVVALGTVAESRARPAPAVLAPEVAGEWRWLGSSSVEFVPAAPLSDGTSFTVTVPAGLRGADGSVLAEPFTFSFETPRPRVVAVSPRDRWAWLVPASRLSVTFDRPVADLAGHLRLRVAGQDVPLRVTGEVSVAAEEEALRDPTAGPVRAPPPGFEDRRTRYEITPDRPLPLDAPVELLVAADVHGRDGPLPMGKAQGWTFRTHGPMAVVGAQACEGVDRCPYGPLIVKTTNLADPRSLRSRIRVEPAVEIDWDRVEVNAPTEWDAEWTPHFSLPGRFRPGVEYHVTVDAGVVDEYGQAAAAARVSARTSDLLPSFDVARGAALLEAAGDGSLPIEVENLDRIDATVWALTPSQMARVLGEGRKRKGVGALLPPGPRTYTLDLGGARNVTATRPLPIRQILGGKRSALFYASVRAPGLDPARSPPATVVGQITDLAIHAKLGATRGVVWVTRLSDGKSVGDATIAVFDTAGRSIWTGKTDAEGLCPVPGLRSKDGPDGSPDDVLLVAATKGDDTGVTLSTWAAGFQPWFFGVPADWDGSRPRSLGMVIAERGIYRPGQTVYLKGLTRLRRLGAIETPAPGTKLQLQVTSSRGKEVFAREVETSAYGTFSASFPLDREVPLGTYAIAATGKVDGTEVQYGGTFRVEEYRAPQFRVDVTAPAPGVVAGEPVTARVLARYLFGGAMADAGVAWSVNRSTLDFRPPGNEGFEFGNQVGFWEDHLPGETREVASSGKGRTDGSGGFAIEAGSAEAPGSRTWEYVLEAEVADVNRQRVADRASVLVHPASKYAGVRRRGSGFSEAGKPVTFELVAVTPGGAREDGEIELALRRREWKSIRKKGVGDRWTTISEPVEEPAGQCRVRAGAVAAACTLTPAKPGLHVVEATVTDAKGRRQTTRTGFYVVGDGWASWSRDDTDRVEIVPDKELYDVGETARVLVKNPFPDAEALLTVEREGVTLQRRVRLGSGATTLEVPIPESAVPNVFVSVVLTRGRQAGMPVSGKDDPGRPVVRIGYAQLKVEKRSKRLEVALQVDAPVRRPREKVKVDVQVRDANGKGVPAEVALWAVDDGVLRLTGYKVPDPVEAIHPLRGLSVRVSESLVHLIQRRIYGDKGLGAGGSGGFDPAGAAFRANFRTTAVFLPEVATDASGKAQVEFELPDNLTTFRIMAVAVTRGDRMGSGESRVTVAKPLLVLPALPRMARVGDTFEAGVVLHAPGGKVREAEVAVTATGLVLEGDARRRVALEPGKAREVRFRFRAERPGEAVLRFTAEGGGEADGVEQRIPVVLPVEREAVAVSGDTRDVRSEALVPPAGVRPDVGGLQLSLASTAIAGMDESMRQLVDYPYGCLEQLSSRLVPFVTLRELQGKFGVKPPPGGDAAPEAWMLDWVGEDSLRILQARDPDEVIRRTVKAIEVLQNPDGGYRYWPSGGCSDELASSYAVLALGRAAEVGFLVDRGALRRGQGYLADTVAAGKCTSCGWGCLAPEPSTRVFALHALARTGAPRASYYPALLAEREKLPLFAQAMLADAMFVGGGDRAAAMSLLAGLLGHARVSPSEVHMEEDRGAGGAARWSSDVRTTAIVLSTLTDLSPDHPFVAPMAAWLAGARGRDGRYRNTQEAAFALTAAAEVVRTREREAPDFTGIVTLGDKRLAEVPFHGRSLERVQRSIPIGDLGAGGAAVPFSFRRDGKAGVLYYGAVLRYAPEKMPVDALDRGIFVQRWFEPYEGGGQVRTVRAGDLVRVRVRVGTPQGRRDVAVEVPVPAGLEIVDTSLASTASLPRVRGEPERGEYASDEEDDAGPSGGVPDFARGYWTPFNHTERRDDRLVLFADRLPAGIHETSFVARATTPGHFVSRPARAEEMYAPEVFGRSDGGVFVVVDPEAGNRR
jgi:uncharacterized protein YfaS (alpha-2-macroglobulin family)